MRIILLKDSESGSAFVIDQITGFVDRRDVGIVKTLVLEDGQQPFDTPNKVKQGFSKFMLVGEDSDYGGTLWTSGIDRCIGFIMDGTTKTDGGDKRFVVLYHHQEEKQETLIRDFFLRTLGQQPGANNVTIQRITMVRHNYQDENAQEFERVFTSIREGASLVYGDIKITIAPSFQFIPLKTEHVTEESLGIYLDFRAGNEAVYIYRGLYSLGAELDSSAEEYTSSGESGEDKPKFKVPKLSGEMAFPQEIPLGDLPPQLGVGILGVAYGGSVQQAMPGANVKEKSPAAITFSGGPKEHKSSAQAEKKEVTLDQSVGASEMDKQQAQITHDSTTPQARPKTPPAQ